MEHVAKIKNIIFNTDISDKAILFQFNSLVLELKDRCNIDEFTEEQYEKIYYMIAMKISLIDIENELYIESKNEEEIISIGDTSIKESNNGLKVKISEIESLKTVINNSINSFVVNNRRMRW